MESNPKQRVKFYEIDSFVYPGTKEYRASHNDVSARIYKPNEKWCIKIHHFHKVINIGELDSLQKAIVKARAKINLLSRIDNS